MSLLDQPIEDGKKEVDVDKLQSHLTLLEQALLKVDPQFPQLLRLIHEDLRNQPELAHMLTPQQVRIYVNGAQRFSKIQIVQESARKKKTPKPNEVPLDEF